MKRDEWYDSAKFLKLRLGNNISHEVLHKVQHLHDLIALLDKEYGPLMVCDKFNLVERQLRIVNLEIGKFIGFFGDLERMMSPNKFDDDTTFGLPKTEEAQETPKDNPS